MTSKTHETFVAEMLVKHPDILVVGRYIAARKPLACKCKLDFYEWNAMPNNLLSGSGCPRCGNVAPYSHESFVCRIKELFPSIIVLGKYTNNRTKLQYRCSIDGYEWANYPDSLLNAGRGCHKCSGRERYTTKTFSEKLKLISPDITVLGEFVSRSIKILVQHSCGHSWFVDTSNLLMGSGCPECSTYGYKVSKHSFFYIYLIGDKIGFGITGDLVRRDRDHRRNFTKHGTVGELIYVFDGSVDIRNTECAVKKLFEICPIAITGFKTETLDSKDLPRLLEMLYNTPSITPFEVLL